MKTKINFIVDALMLLNISVLAGIGFLMSSILIPGEQRWEKYGANVDLSWLGMSRHEWGSVHFHLGMLLLLLMVLHIALHWRMIGAMFKLTMPHTGSRKIAAIVFAIICLILLLFPFFIKPTVGEPETGQGRRTAILSGRLAEGNGENLVSQAKQGRGQGTSTKIESSGRGVGSGRSQENALEIKGFMTIAEVAQKYSVPAAYLKERLELPESISEDERLGRLRRTYGFTMKDMEEAVITYQNQQ